MSKDNSEIMSFEEYLKRIKSNPAIVKGAHARIYEAIMRRGFKVVSWETDERLARILALQKGEKMVVYDLFSDFYGLEQEIEKIVAYYRSASFGGETSRLFLFLLGPPSSGKSSLVRTIYSALHDEEIYFIDRCPIKEEPLNLIPRHERRRIEADLGIRIPGDGELCPVCRKRLKTEFELDYKRFKVRKHHISVRASRHFASVDPTDPMSFDKSKFVGSVTLGEREGDPSAFELDGAFCRANRGLLEMVEIFKNTPEVLYLLLEATQSKTIESPTGRAEKTFVDVAIIAHSNEAEWQKFVNEKRNEALLDRLVKVVVPYNVRLDEQVKIFEKISVRPGYHLAPWAIESLAALTVLTRIKPSGKIKNIFEKMKIYNGEYIGTDTASAKELREESPNDGMFGMSNRVGAQIFESALANQIPDDKLCVDPTMIFKTAKEFIEALQGLSEEQKRDWLLNLEAVKIWFGDRIEEQFCSFADSFPEFCNEFFKEYLEALRKAEYRLTISERERFLINEIKIPDINVTEELDLRRLMVERFKKMSPDSIKFELAPESLKPVIRRAVTSRMIFPLIQKIVADKESFTLDEATKMFQARIWEKAKELGYCEKCFKAVAQWMIINKRLS